MRTNLPVTNREVELNQHDSIISITNLKGQITFINSTFLTISGFKEEELIGQSHNIVRHPDMPALAFKDLWSKIKAGETWQGIVKNRCKNGDYYWVNAFVTPIYDNGKVSAYQSIRSKATQRQISDAKNLYQQIKEKKVTEIKEAFNLRNVNLMTRIFISLFSAAIIPLIGVALWSQEIIIENLLVTGALISSLIIILTNIFIYYSLFVPLNKSSGILKKMSSGDFVQIIEINSKNEVGQLFLSLKIMQARMHAVIAKISKSSIDISLNAEQLSNLSSESFLQMSKQSQNSMVIVSAISQLSSSIDEIARSATTVSETTEVAVADANQNMLIVGELNSSIQGLITEVGNSSKVISTLDSKSSDISNIIDSINGIAEQTNLLALNAAIEAARAGEQGRGFAVVADEVRTLAVRTQEATQEIGGVIDSLKYEIKNAIEVMGKGQKQALIATEQSTQTLKSLETIRSTISEINNMSLNIKQTTQEQSQASLEINEKLNDIASSTSTTLALAQNVSQNGKNVYRESNLSLEQFEIFKIGLDFNQLKEEVRLEMEKHKPQPEEELL